MQLILRNGNIETSIQGLTQAARCDKTCDAHKRIQPAPSWVGKQLHWLEDGDRLIPIDSNGRIFIRDARLDVGT